MFQYDANTKAVVNNSQLNLQARLRNSNAVIDQTQQSCVCAQQRLLKIIKLCATLCLTLWDSV